MGTASTTLTGSVVDPSKLPDPAKLFAGGTKVTKTGDIITVTAGLVWTTGGGIVAQGGGNLIGQDGNGPNSLE